MADDEEPLTPWGGTVWQWLGITKEESQAMERDFPNTVKAWEGVCSNGGPCESPCKCLKDLMAAMALDIAQAQSG